jgi:chromosome segregation protein
MYLKNLTVLGFKSFPDKTSLNFLPGITAIVGPNGCGKSNVADAIRWVLGEQSARALRGGEMADVIFNGTDGRRPLGLAEVSITIGGVDQEHLKAAGVELAYDEVTVTRRVFRDGGSEYFVNKTPCRLKDIQQLFAGTGVGRSSYSIMAQGNITQILSSKPEDRRLVFEEAAGITRFKAQKKEALRKLESTEQNLLRVDDLVREVKRQIISLQRQAGKARRFKQFMAELQHLDTQLARHQYDTLQREIADRQDRLERLRQSLESASQDVVRAEEEVGQLRANLATHEHEIAQSQQRGLQIKADIERHESRIHFNSERTRELAAQETRAHTDISTAEERQRAAEDELASAVERLAAATARLDEFRATLDSRRAAFNTVEQELRTCQESLRQTQSEIFGLTQQLSRARNALTALDLQKQGNIVRLEKLSAEKLQLEEERVRLEQRVEDFTRESEAEKVNLQTQRSTCEQRQQRLRDLHHEIAAVAQDLDRLQHQQSDKLSRRNVLQQLEAAHEGFEAGPLAALQETQLVLGLLADRLRVPPDCVIPFEAALGHHLQLVLTEQTDAAQRILADLSANRKGRVSIAPLELRAASTQPPPPPPPPELESRLAQLDCSPALARVEIDEPLRPLLLGLLGRTFIAPDLATATTAWRESGGTLDFVTRTGELLSHHGVFTGGAANASGKAPSSILGRKNQIAELDAALAQLQEQIAEVSRRKGACSSEQTALQATLLEAQTELRTQEVALATRQGEFNALQHALRVLHQKIDTVVYEIQSLAAQEQEGNDRRAGLAAQAAELESREQDLQTRLNDCTASLESLRLQRDQTNASMTEAKVAAATEEQVAAAFRQQQGPLEQRILELGQLAEQRRREIETLGQRRQQADLESAESRARIDALQHDREQCAVVTAEQIGQRDSLAADIAAREDSLRNQRRLLAEHQEQRGTLEVELAQKTMAAQNLCERIQQKYQINLLEVRGEGITITFAADGPAKVVTLTPEEMAAAGVSTDWTAVAEQVASLQQRIDEMGPVNLVAIQDYEEAEQRHQFLSTQHEDLVKAKAQLVEVINRVNTQTREMFTDTFNRIRDNFRVMFVEIFGGGSADLALVDEGDVLESGIDIMARPPGKQLRSISLLSGGEQTMTAVALLFAIYQVRPSPFCVLDELDAPLDESNINRFIRILQRFLAHSQFIVITHNKRTIAMASVLYGVTMQEQGVSRIVSVKFHKSDDVVTDHTPQSIETPVVGPTVAEEEDRPDAPGETLEVSVTE